MVSTLRNSRHRFHEKSTLIFAILKYLQFKGATQVVDFLLQNILELLVIHLCLAKTFLSLSLSFFLTLKSKVN